MSAILQAFKDPDLRKKILITLALMILYRIGAQIPTPGVDYALINSRLEEVAQGDNATMFSIIGLFSGGALLQLSIFAIGIMPYITASIIVAAADRGDPEVRGIEEGRAVGPNQDDAVHALPHGCAGAAAVRRYCGAGRP